MDNVTLRILTSNYVVLYDKLLVSRNDQVDLTYMSTNQKVTNEPLDMVVILHPFSQKSAVCIVREQTIVKLLLKSYTALNETIKLFNSLLSGFLYMVLDGPSKDELQFLTDLDFNSPDVVDNKIIVFKSLTPSPEFTQLELRRVKMYADQPSIKLDVRFDKGTLETLSGYVNTFDNEVGGTLHIYAYDDKDRAIIRFNPIDLVLGEATSVSVPFETISFHTHPDLCYRTLGCYIAWPSSTDMVYLLSSYFSGKPTLLHVVSTAEGVWVMQLTPIFQRILFYLYMTDRPSCIQVIMDIVLDKFTKLHDLRQVNIIPPLLRPKAKKDYEALVKIITLTDLFELYPDLASTCSGAVIEDGQLYSITLASWDQIVSIGGNLDITIEYIPALKYAITLPITYGKVAYDKIKSLPCRVG